MVLLQDMSVVSKQEQGFIVHLNVFNFGDDLYVGSIEVLMATCLLYISDISGFS